MSKPERGLGWGGLPPPGHHGALGRDPVKLQAFMRDAVEVRLAPGMAEALRHAAAGLGLALPGMGESAGTGSATGAVTTLGLAPGEWLALARPEEPGAFARRIASGLEAAASVVETGHGLACFSVSGRAAREVLAKGCRLDLHPAVFTSSTAARTVIAQIPVTLWRKDEAGAADSPVFALAVPLTFAQSFAHFLLGASAGTGAEILPASKD